jgi:hypothetical protein
MREERLLRDFPPCEHYLLRAFKGRTLADSEAAAGDSSLRGSFVYERGEVAAGDSSSRGH